MTSWRVQTTGIATINSSQLKAFPVIIPPFSEQENWENAQNKIEKIKPNKEALKKHIELPKCEVGEGKIWYPSDDFLIFAHDIMIECYGIISTCRRTPVGCGVK